MLGLIECSVSFTISKYFHSCRFIIITCAISPFFLAFPNDETHGWSTFAYVINIFFLFDIFVNFRSAYYEIDYHVVDKPWVSIYLGDYFLANC